MVPKAVAASVLFFLLGAFPAYAQSLPQAATTFSTTLDKGTYVWGAPITITLSVSTTGEAVQNGAFTFDAVVKNKDKQDCAVIARNQPIRGGNVLTPIPTEKDEYLFVLPDGKGCEGAGIAVTLKTQSGMVIGSKDFAVTMSAPSTPTLVETYGDTAIRVGVLLLVLCGIGYVVWRRRKTAIKSQQVPDNL